MSKFKTGDRVVAVRDVVGFDFLVAFKEYTTCHVEGAWITLDNGHSYSDHMFDLAPCNGVDASGKPLNFTEDMLQPFQRVVDRAGRTWIVGPKKPCGKYALLGNGKCVHMEFANTEDDCSGLSEYIADEVYDMPMYYDALDHTEKGNLIWKRKAPQTPQEKAVKDIENAIKHLEKNLEALKATL